MVERFQKKVTVTGRTQETFACLDHLMEVVAFTLAAGRGLMYWNSSQQGGERWAKYLGTGAGLYASQVGGSVTNALFNWVAYRCLLNARKSHSKEEKIITKVKGEKIKWGASFLTTFLRFYLFGRKV
ncbi:hypothetical protein [Coxiella endosymbiont of Ornithodoros maritimus]|uniref:hypothetical protein n=1 Tax=Coxiella endosymbiont of Ornithodoros maritimus TaxID=1656172 RepID=UPI002264D8A2|nr:hypothetical protein [Coxiella endosymbiont of Ornithodoros maritimus]